MKNDTPSFSIKSSIQKEQKVIVKTINKAKRYYRQLVQIKWSILSLQQLKHYYFKHKYDISKMSNFFNLEQIGNLQSFESLLYPQPKKNISQSTNDQKDSQNFLETRISQPEKDVGQYFSKPSTKAQPFTDSNFQVSFFQEHNFIFQKYIRNYIELFGLNYQITLTIGQSINDIRKDMSQIKLQLFIKNEVQEFTGQQMEGFLERIKNYQKLLEFMEYVVNHYDRTISISLIKIIKIIVECQGHSDYMRNLNEKEIISRASQIINTAQFNQIKQVLIKKDHIQSKELIEKLKKFSIFLANTVLFICNGFFVNPYYQLQEVLIVREYLNYQFILYDITSNNIEQQQDDYQGNTGRKRIKTQYD